MRTHSTFATLAVAVCVVCPASPVLAARPAPQLQGSAAPRSESARDMYTRAMAQERDVRDETAHPTLVQMRRVIAAYERVVRAHPASGYADNALWQAANL